jgi:hypothetical protein
VIHRALAVAVLLASLRAEAAHCRAIEGGTPALERMDAQLRIDWIRDRLRTGARRARIWAWTWAGIYSALTVGNLILSGVDPEEKKVDDYLGAAASFIGLGTFIVTPLRIMRDQRWLDRRLRNAPPGIDPCVLVADAERLLIRDADGEAFGKSPLVHAGNFGINLACALILGLGFGHWDQAAIQGAVGIVIGEVMILTQPQEAIHDLARYRRGELGADFRYRPFAWGLAPLVGHDRAGLILGAAF